MNVNNQISKCNICGKVIEELQKGAPATICCGKEMEIFLEKTSEEGNEKHLPVALRLDDGSVKVKVGEVPHPMEAEHYIEWVQIKTSDNRFGRKFLVPDDSTEIIFHTKTDIIEVRAYCNVHGLWKAVL